jgi:predicted nucleic acid-binding protein
MPTRLPAVYWDACCFLGKIQREKDRISELDHLTKEAENKKLLIVTSTLTITEVLYGDLGKGDSPEGIKKARAYFEHPWIVLRAVDRRTSELAADIRIAHPSLKIPDAIHVATALRWEVKYLHTYDDTHLLKKNGLIGTPPLEIIKPRTLEDHPLFASIKEDDPL